VLFGGLLFQPLGHDFLEAYQVDDMRVRYFYDYYVSDELYAEHPEVIILSAVLPDPINTYVGDFRNGIVDEINEVKIKTLKDVADAFAKPSKYYVVSCSASGVLLCLKVVPWNPRGSGYWGGTTLPKNRT